MYIASSNHTVGQVFNVPPDTIRFKGFLSPNTDFHHVTYIIRQNHPLYKEKFMPTNIYSHFGVAIWFFTVIMRGAWVVSSVG